MIPDRDYYADKNEKLTNDPDKFAFQIATKGVFLDERVAKRYGITETPAAVEKPKKAKPEPEPIKKSEQPEEETEPEAEEPKAEAAKPAEKDDDKGAKKK